MEAVLFYLFSGLALISSLAVITHPKPTRALIALIVAMFALTVLYVLLHAPFVAMVHLIVYAGAVLVLFLFVIMLQGIGARDIPLVQRFRPTHWIAALAVTGALALVLAGACFGILNQKGQGLKLAANVEEIGTALFHDYLLPFELISILLLLGIFAAVALAKEDARS